MANTSPFNHRSSADEVLQGRNLSGQVILVTGANTGIGYETARSLAVAGATVIGTCRTAEKAAATKLRLQQAHPGIDLETAVMDLASLASVSDFCKQLSHSVIDTVICNAGIVAPEYGETSDGFEQTVGICHIGHFLLVTSLLPRILSATAPRVVMVSSESHRAPPHLNFDALPYPKASYRPMKAYGQAKLCNALMAVELHRRFSDQGLTACYLHPGTMVTTDIGRDSALIRFAMLLVRPFTKTANQGAATSVFCATWDDCGELGGNYFSHCAKAKPSAETANAQVATRLWERSERWLQEKGYSVAPL
ncbi:Fatty acyl-CoA reductase [Halioglobus japonicus]|nr:Fatty acyl-CoA reductase [Halioglobus japonicus]